MYKFFFLPSRVITKSLSAWATTNEHDDDYRQESTPVPGALLYSTMLLGLFTTR